MKVSLIIPSYNSCRTIDRLFGSLFLQKSADCVQEIIVVDSSDDKNTRDVIKGINDPRMKVILLDQKTSPARARNTGARHATGELLCFIDSDVYLAEDWLEKILAAYAKGCKVGCGSVSLPSFQQDDPLAKAQLYLQFNEYLYPVSLDLQYPLEERGTIPRSSTCKKVIDIANLRKRGMNAGEMCVRAFVPSCNLFCDREVFERAGGFPDLRASEDTLFCLRLGGIEKIWFIPAAKSFHIFRQEWQGFARNQQLLGKYVAIYRRMYYKNWIYKGIIPVILFPGFLILKSIRIALRIRTTGTIHFRQFLSAFGVFALGLFYWSEGFLGGCFAENEITECSIRQFDR